MAGVGSAISSFWAKQNRGRAAIIGSGGLLLGAGGVLVLGFSGATILTVLAVMSALVGVAGLGTAVSALLVHSGYGKEWAINMAAGWGVAWWMEYPKLGRGLISIIFGNPQPLVNFINKDHGPQTTRDRIARWSGLGVIVLLSVAGAFVSYHVTGQMIPQISGILGTLLNHGAPSIAFAVGLLAGPLINHLISNFALFFFPGQPLLSTSGPSPSSATPKQAALPPR